MSPPMMPLENSSTVSPSSCFLVDAFDGGFYLGGTGEDGRREGEDGEELELHCWVFFFFFFSFFFGLGRGRMVLCCREWKIGDEEPIWQIIYSTR